jgi:pantetheine-phosphate adenylyltransferase
MKIAVFPGTFDPITFGHVDVIERGRKMFDRIIVAVGVNPGKAQLFPVEERLKMIRNVIGRMKNVTVESYEGLTVDLVRRRKAVAILRGLRNMTDLEFEFQIALTNRAVANVETAFVMTSEQFGFTSSSLIKQVVGFGGDPQDFSRLLPKLVIQKLKEYHAKKIGPFRDLPADALKT